MADTNREDTVVEERVGRVIFELVLKRELTSDEVSRQLTWLAIFRCSISSIIPGLKEPTHVNKDLSGFAAHHDALGDSRVGTTDPKEVWGLGVSAERDSKGKMPTHLAFGRFGEELSVL